MRWFLASCSGTLSDKLNQIFWFQWDWLDIVMNLFWVAKIWDNMLSCLKIKWTCLRATLHAPKMNAVVQMVSLHRKEEASEGILQYLRLLGDGKVSNVEETKWDMVDWWCKQRLPWEMLLDVTQPLFPLPLEWKLNCLWNVISQFLWRTWRPFSTS